MPEGEANPSLLSLGDQSLISGGLSLGAPKVDSERVRPERSGEVQKGRVSLAR